MKYFAVLLMLIGFGGLSHAQEFDSSEDILTCEPPYELVDGICKLLIRESAHSVNTSPFYQGMMFFSLFLWPFFISGSAIFIVLVKTPRFAKPTRISVTIFGSVVIVCFLIMMFIGIWPQFGD